MVVHTKAKDAYRGLLWERTGGYLVLKKAELLRTDGLPVPMDGELMIYREDVDVIQVFT